MFCSLTESMHHNRFRHCEVNGFFILLFSALSNQIIVSQHIKFLCQPVAMQLHKLPVAECLRQIEPCDIFLTSVFYLSSSDMVASTAISVFLNTSVATGRCAVFFFQMCCEWFRFNCCIVISQPHSLCCLIDTLFFFFGSVRYRTYYITTLSSRQYHDSG